MRALPEVLDPDVVSEIDARLDGVEQQHDVRILWATENGSRAWGYPSPDSDYDCRFVFVRPQEEYLSLWPQRDVIETPLERDFDVNGWDLAKSLRLIVKGSAAAVEWLRSPIVYRGDDGFRDRILAFADEVTDRAAIARHYQQVGARQRQHSTESLKRFFDALRPAAALRWMTDHPDATLPPMDLPTLLEESSVDVEVREAANELIAAKAATHELDSGQPAEVLEHFVDEELARAAVYDMRRVQPSHQSRALAEEFFRHELA